MSRNRRLSYRPPLHQRQFSLAPKTLYRERLKAEVSADDARIDLNDAVLNLNLVHDKHQLRERPRRPSRLRKARRIQGAMMNQDSGPITRLLWSVPLTIETASWSSSATDAIRFQSFLRAPRRGLPCTQHDL